MNVNVANNDQGCWIRNTVFKQMSKFAKEHGANGFRTRSAYDNEQQRRRPTSIVVAAVRMKNVQWEAVETKVQISNIISEYFVTKFRSFSYEKQYIPSLHLYSYSVPFYSTLTNFLWTSCYVKQTRACNRDNIWKWHSAFRQKSYYALYKFTFYFLLTYGIRVT